MYFYRLKCLLFCLILVIASCGSVIAADEGALKIGVMNVQKVLVQSDAGVKARDIFEKKKSELEETLKAEQEKLQKLQDEIEKKSSVWSKEKKDEQILEFNKMRRDLKTQTDDSRMEMKRLQDKELEPIVKVLEKVVDKFGEDNGYSMILDSKNGVIFYDKAHDISDDLIKELNKAMK